MRFILCQGFSLSIFLLCCSGDSASEPLRWLVFEGMNGPGQGKHVVLISGDEEYRSEEALPQLGKILSRHHGFKCTVLFAQKPETPGIIDPDFRENIPGLEALREADLMIIATRFRALPDEQMREIDDYLTSGRPVVGLRTATHAFRFPADSKWAHYSFNYSGEKSAWHNGFGELVLGTSWISHHGWHKKESTRGIPAGNHEINNGIGEGDIWGPSDVYGVKLPQPGDSRAVVLGQVLAGMEKDDPPIGPGPYERVPKYGQNPGFHKNDPMMPLAWTKSYQLPDGRKGKVFATTMGASTDLVAAGTRRMIVNGVYWCLGLPVPEGGSKVDIVGSFDPSAYGFNEKGYWEAQNVSVQSFSN